MLAMQSMIFNPVHPHRLKGSKPHVQRDLRCLDSTISYARKDLWGEVKAGGWRRYRTAGLRVNRLIAFSVAWAVRPINIGRQGHMPESFNQTKEVGCRTKAYAALTKTFSSYNLGLQFTPGFIARVWLVPVSEKQLFSHTNLAPWPDQALPFVGILRYLPGEQYLDPALEKVAGRRISRAHRLRFSPAPPAVEACRKDPCIIQDNQIVCPEQLRKVTKPAILKPSGGAVYSQQAGSSAVGEGLLSDELGRKPIIEF